MLVDPRGFVGRWGVAVAWLVDDSAVAAAVTADMKLLLSLLALLASVSRSVVASVQHRDIVVVGGGLSGATTAFYLHKGGKDVLLAEAADRIGGAVNTKKGGGFQWEEGPNSFKPTPEIVKLAMDLHIDQELLVQKQGSSRYLYVYGKRHDVASPLGFLWSGPVSIGSKLRILMARAGLVFPAPKDKEESIYDFGARHVGEENMNVLGDAILGGVYAGDPKRLSMKSAFP